MIVGPLQHEKTGKLVLDAVNKYKNLSYMGEYSIEQINKLMRRAKLLVNTSLNREGFPNFAKVYARNLRRRVEEFFNLTNLILS